MSFTTRSVYDQRSLIALLSIKRICALPAVSVLPYLHHSQCFISLLRLPPFPERIHSPSLVLSMASDNTSYVATDSSAANIAVDVKYGFQRPEMYSEKLAGTVNAYGRHVFLCYKSYEAWDSRVENADSDPLPKLLASAMKARKNDIDVKTMLTICEGGKDTDFADGDVLMFPEMRKYKGLKESDIDIFVEEVLVNCKPWTAGVQEELTGSHIFVCAHASRDKRCGVCGPILIQKFNEEIELLGLKDRVFVHACSHVGGHKYAGNLIVFCPGADGIIAGNWYGYVTPDDVVPLLDLHIGKGEIIERIWRGRMGTAAESTKESEEMKLANGEVVHKNDNSRMGTDSQSSNENFTGCCQGANGFSCCRDASLEKSGTDGIDLKNVPEAKKRQFCSKFSTWINVWDQSDILTAAAVIGAVGAVAVAYSLYRRSS